MSIQVTIVGNLTADPELRYTQGGLPVTGFTVAVNERKLNRETQQWEDGDTTFVRCSAWREMAEQVAQSLTKGTRVIATGKVKMQEYETKDGQKGSSLEMQVDEIGPSLRYATAVVTKTPRREGGTNPGAPMAMQTPGGYGQQQTPGYGGQPQQGWAQPQVPQGPPPGAWAQPGAYGDDTPF